MKEMLNTTESVTKLTFKDIPKSIVDTYYLANTTSFLYSMLRKDFYIVNYLSQRPASELINFFNEKKNKPIAKMDEMAMMYAIIVALTFKERKEVEGFFADVSKIKYEWFSDLVNLYFTNYNPPPIIYSATIPSPPAKNEPLFTVSDLITFR